MKPWIHVLQEPALDRARGFGMVEVLVALIVISVGMLGIAKMQALAYSSTNVASLRSLAAIEASSMATSMHAERSFWSAGLAADVTISSTSSGYSISDSALAASVDCAANVCTDPAMMAAYDVQKWADSLKQTLPNFVATISCPSTNIPVSCTISLVWDENTVALNKQQTGGTQQSLSYTLYVDP